MFGMKEKIETVKSIPDQIKWTLTLAAAAFIVAMIALSMTMVGGYRAN